MSKVVTKVIETPIKCVVCLGSGESPTNPEMHCVACGGDGVNFVTEEITETEKEPEKIDLGLGNPTVGTIYYNWNYETCPSCGGSGRVPSYTYWSIFPTTEMCTHCWGFGKVLKNYTPSVYPNYRPWLGQTWCTNTDTTNNLKYSVFNVSDKAL
jgi:DnaJ-class molecular chaperone